MSEQAQIEIETDDNNDTSPEPQTQPPAPKPQPTASRLNITRKKVNDLTEAERAQLIREAQEGIENDFFQVKLFKNGSTRICLRKQSKAQQVLADANEQQSSPATQSTSRRYYTDNQLLMEHIINLETSFNALKTKHKKLKKRYNELEGYLYNDDEQPQPTAPEEQPQPPIQPQQQPQQQQQPIQQQQPTPIIQEEQQQQQFVQQPVRRRYVRSWRDITPLQQ